MTASNLPEAALYERLADAFRENGFRVYGEVPGKYGSMVHDMVAVRQRWLYPVVVELKVSFTRHLLYQSRIAQLTSPVVFAAAGTRPGRGAIEAARVSGFGLLTVRPEGVRMIMRPIIHRKPWQPGLDSLRETLAEMEEGGPGGLPTQKGKGPGIEVYLAVRDYREAHPEARWREVFENVPNHYSSVNSLVCCMNKRGPDGRLRGFSKPQLADAGAEPQGGN